MSTHFIVGNLIKTIKNEFLKKLFFLFTRKWVLQRNKRRRVHCRAQTNF